MMRVAANLQRIARKMTLSLFDSERSDQAKDKGQAAVSSHNQEFMEAIRTRAVALATVRGAVSSDELRSFAEARGLEPDHPNAWGAVFRGEPKLGYKWVRIGDRKSTIVSNHSRRISVWAIRPK